MSAYPPQINATAPSANPNIRSFKRASLRDERGSSESQACKRLSHQSQQQHQQQPQKNSRRQHATVA